jgi:hypothetical protein
MSLQRSRGGDAGIFGQHRQAYFRNPGRIGAPEERLEQWQLLIETNLEWLQGACWSQ